MIAHHTKIGQHLVMYFEIDAQNDERMYESEERGERCRAKKNRMTCCSFLSTKDKGRPPHHA